MGGEGGGRHGERSEKRTSDCRTVASLTRCTELNPRTVRRRYCHHHWAPGCLRDSSGRWSASFSVEQSPQLSAWCRWAPPTYHALQSLSLSVSVSVRTVKCHPSVHPPPTLTSQYSHTEVLRVANTLIHPSTPILKYSGYRTHSYTPVL